MSKRSMMDIACITAVVQGFLWASGLSVVDPFWYVFTIGGTWIIFRCMR